MWGNYNDYINLINNLIGKTMSQPLHFLGIATYRAHSSIFYLLCATPSSLSLASAAGTLAQPFFPGGDDFNIKEKITIFRPFSNHLSSGALFAAYALLRIRVFS